MNTNKGSYREFIKANGITEGREGWEAKIAEVGQEAFQKMEHDFIKEKHYDVMMGKIMLPGKEKFFFMVKIS